NEGEYIRISPFFNKWLIRLSYKALNDYLKQIMPKFMSLDDLYMTALGVYQHLSDLKIFSKASLQRPQKVNCDSSFNCKYMNSSLNYTGYTLQEFQNGFKNFYKKTSYVIDYRHLMFFEIFATPASPQAYLLVQLIFTF